MQRYIRTIRVRAEAEKNTNSAAAESQDNRTEGAKAPSFVRFFQSAKRNACDFFLVCGEMQIKFVHSTLEI
jgi:hypothetical protein